MSAPFVPLARHMFLSPAGRRLYVYCELRDWQNANDDALPTEPIRLGGACSDDGGRTALGCLSARSVAG
jgi:hypothetical protein